MGEVTRVLREVQLNTEGGLVPARGSVPLDSSRRSKYESAVVGATKADRKMAFTRNKDVGSFIGVTKAELANKKAAMAKAASWSDLPGPKEERKAGPPVSLITKETVPQCFIDRIKTYLSKKLPPLPQEVIELYGEFYPDEPKAIASELENITRWNYFVDLEQDCLRQHAEKGYAEVGVDFTNGVKQLLILPQE